MNYRIIFFLFVMMNNMSAADVFEFKDRLKPFVEYCKGKKLDEADSIVDNNVHIRKLDVNNEFDGFVKLNWQEGVSYIRNSKFDDTEIVILFLFCQNIIGDEYMTFLSEAADLTIEKKVSSFLLYMMLFPPKKHLANIWVNPKTESLSDSVIDKLLQIYSENNKVLEKINSLKN